MHRFVARLGTSAVAALTFFVFLATLTPANGSASVRSLGPVILYGDSLADESQTSFTNALAEVGIDDVHVRTFGGTALCDWFADMRLDAEVVQPSAVVVEFSGNAFTTCMHDASGASLTGDDYYGKYMADAIETLRIFAPAHTRIYFVGTPLSRHAAETHDPDAGRLNAQYAAVSSLGLSEYVDAGAAILDRGNWTETLPCRVDEPCSGVIDATGMPANIVRAPDGMHFCPTAPQAIRGVTLSCPVWSSGAFRFGTAMATAVARGFRAPSDNRRAD